MITWIDCRDDTAFLGEFLDPMPFPDHGALENMWTWRYY